jgi:hypothetical protein
MYEWGFISDEALAAADPLPIEAVSALMELMAAVSLDPWGAAVWEPERGNMPTVPFGPAREGQVTILILDGSRKVWITQVHWPD